MSDDKSQPIPQIFKTVIVSVIPKGTIMLELR
jgi:hypothetical protein